MKNSLAIIIGFLIVGSLFVGWKISQDLGPAESASTPQQKTESTSKEIEFNPPSMEDVPDGPLGESIKYGHELVMETNTIADEYVGNNLSCASCHANGGTVKEEAPMVGLSAVYPDYRPREGEVYTLEDRINGCMIRSMNGKMFPTDSKEMRAMIAYLQYMSEGVPAGADLPWRAAKEPKQYPVPSVEDGEKLYAQSCASCHAADGSGTGTNTGPAVWGENSFNDGAGMSRLTKMAGYVQKNMPKGQGGTLTDQQAIDLAAYILSHDRPEFEGHEGDWPKGGRPADIMNKEKREQVKNGTIDWEAMLTIKN
ncbi:c-type cytochrome [Mesobacillus selenatarsenatis]|uniref:C-type cytochrome n=1 Tax=Mesobacillus selenatarsenatis TaxID=388741 RepID=A0A846TUL9_9BACI|nr:c-type cytochrome [Mesobacillus selenatarsenatis]NKE06051.1 c-type cytochrome [Mesobacillus selenatarsenatis]